MERFVNFHAMTVAAFSPQRKPLGTINALSPKAAHDGLTISVTFFHFFDFHFLLWHSFLRMDL
jgi:hypothetical protein